MTKIYVDFHNTTSAGAVRLNTIGSIKDLNTQGIRLQNGLLVCLYSEDFEVTGKVEFFEEERAWVARFDWDLLKPLSAGNIA